MAPDVATALARLADRERWTVHDDLVFPGVAGGYLDGSALPAGTRRHSSERRSGRCASTTSATRSAPG
jgi:hypothetical protein